jgi:hypothetical protein
LTDELEAGFAWQVGIWDRMAEIFQREIDRRFAPIIQELVNRTM